MSCNCKCQVPAARAVYDSPSAQAVAAGGLVNLPEVTVDTNCMGVTGGTVRIQAGGDYTVDFNATAVATAAGPVEVVMYRDGAPVSGARSAGTAAAVGDLVPLAFSTIVSVDCCAPTQLTFRATQATSFTVANALVVKAE